MTILSTELTLMPGDIITMEGEPRPFAFDRNVYGLRDDCGIVYLGSVPSWVLHHRDRIRRVVRARIETDTVFTADALAALRTIAAAAPATPEPPAAAKGGAA